MKYFNPINEFFLEDKFQSIVLFNHVLAFLLRDTNSQKYPTHNTYTHTYNPLDVSSEGSSSLRNCEFPRSQSSESPRLPDNQEVTRVSICTIQIQTMLPSLTINLVWRRDRSTRPFWGSRVKFDHRHTDLNYSARRNRKEASLPAQRKTEHREISAVFLFFFLPILRKRLNDCTIPFPTIEGKEGELSGRIFKVDIDSNIG